MLHDRNVVGGRDLPAVREAALEAVIVRRVVAGRDDHARVGAEVADREAQLRRRAGIGEEVRLAPQLGPGRGEEFRKVAGEMPDIMGDHEPGGRMLGGDLAPEAEPGAEDVEIIQASRADGGPDG